MEELHVGDDATTDKGFPAAVQCGSIASQGHNCDAAPPPMLYLLAASATGGPIAGPRNHMVALMHAQ